MMYDILYFQRSRTISFLDTKNGAVKNVSNLSVRVVLLDFFLFFVFLDMIAYFGEVVQSYISSPCVVDRNVRVHHEFMTRHMKVVDLFFISTSALMALY